MRRKRRRKGAKERKRRRKRKWTVSVCWKIMINNCQTVISLRYENDEKF